MNVSLYKRGLAATVVSVLIALVGALLDPTVLAGLQRVLTAATWPERLTLLLPLVPVIWAALSKPKAPPVEPATAA